MLKKSVFGLAFGLLFFPVLSFAGKPSASVYVLQLKDGGNVLDSQSIAVVPGKSAQLSDEKTVSYVSGIKKQGSDVRLQNSYFSTGMSGELRVSAKHPNVLRLSVLYTRLLQMRSFVLDGHTIGRPVLQSYTFVDSVAINNGQSVTLSSWGKSQKVSLVITRSN